VTVKGSDGSKNLRKFPKLVTLGPDTCAYDLSVQDSPADELRTLARQALGPDDGDRLVDLALPAVRLHPAPEGVGRSRLGGAPLLEPTQPWPHWGERPLSFVALLDAEDLVDANIGLSLPRRGLLNFFYEADEQMAWGFDPEHADGWKVVLADPSIAQERGRLDGALDFTECPVRGREVLTLPDPAEPVLYDIRERHDDPLYDLSEKWDKIARIEEPHHQVGGWPSLVQNPLQTECQLASTGVYCGSGGAYADPRYEEVRRGAAEWRLLLQLDSDEAPGWMWGDCGSLYYCIRGDAADASALEAAWMIFQCC
jgi:uncharacterized protein YwqG